jgi:Flp pilus assembly secretin CpaC
VPGIGNIPIIGLLFTSKAAQKDQTELVVMITPVILPNNSTGVSPTLPRTPEPFMSKLPEKQTLTPQAPAFGDARALMAPVPVPTAAAPQPARTGAANAAAAVSTVPPAGAKPAAKSQASAQQKPPKVDEKAHQEEIKQQTAKILADRKKADEDRERQEKLAKEQQKHDAEAARKAGEDARKKAEQDRDQQKSIDEAAARLKAAEAAYNAELTKKGKQ